MTPVGLEVEASSIRDFFFKFVTNVKPSPSVTCAPYSVVLLIRTPEFEA